MITEIAKKVLRSGYICDSCLGRQFGNLLSGYSNRERGKAIKTFLAMEYETRPFKINLSNFHGFKFRKRKVISKKPGKCSVCGGLFENLGKISERIIRKLGKTEFNTFLIGIKLNDTLVIREEALWERVGISYCEQLKTEVSRELGKLVEKRLGKKVDMKKPDVQILVDLQKNKIDIHVNPIYIYGNYKKLVRGIPQTKWDKYKTTVEDVIAKPFMKALKAQDHSLHACGREDIDARCLGWRQFILEMENPKRRKINLDKVRNEINKTKKVSVKDLRLSGRKEVVKLKSMKPDKVYRVTVEFEKPVVDVKIVKRIIGRIKQKTPRRVLHRRANKLRIKKVKSINWKRINRLKYQFEIRTEAGVYIKELVTGDSGRTRPSISEVLENPGKPRELDVIKIIV